jgi:O-antigen/teichoic acid export membrane protein
MRLITNSLLLILIARFYGAESFGQFATAHALSTIFVLVADFGIDLLLATQVARNRADASAIFQHMLAIKIVFSTFAFVLMCLFPIVRGATAPVRYLTWMLAFYMVGFTLLNFLFSLFRGEEELQHEAKTSIVMNLSLLAVLVVLGVLHASIYLIAAAFVASRLLGLSTALLRSRDFVDSFRPKWDYGWFRGIGPDVRAFGLFVLFGNLFFTQDTILLAWWKGDHEVGIYQAVFRLIVVSLVLADILVGALLPTLTRFHGEKREEWTRLGTFANKTMLFCGLVLGVILVVYAQPIINLVYGRDNFAEAIPIMRIFGITVVVRYAVETPALLLTTARLQKARTALVMGGTILNFVLNFFAIPKFGGVGAAVVSCLTNMVLGAGYVIAIHTSFNLNGMRLNYILPVLLSVLLGAGLFFFDVPMIFGVPLVVCAIAAASYFLGYDSTERHLLVKGIR